MRGEPDARKWERWVWGAEKDRGEEGEERTRVRKRAKTGIGDGKAGAGAGAGVGAESQELRAKWFSAPTRLPSSGSLPRPPFRKLPGCFCAVLVGESSKAKELDRGPVSEAATLRPVQMMADCSLDENRINYSFVGDCLNEQGVVAVRCTGLMWTVPGDRIREDGAARRASERVWSGASVDTRRSRAGSNEKAVPLSSCPGAPARRLLPRGHTDWRPSPARLPAPCSTSPGRALPPSAPRLPVSRTR